MWLRVLCCAVVLAHVLGDDETCPSGAGDCKNKGMPPKGVTPKGSKYHWPRARGNPDSYMVTSHSIPFNLSAAFKWKWNYPTGKYHTNVRGNPLIDDKKNIYIVTEAGLFKLSPEGKELWRYDPPKGAITHHVPSIMDGYLYGGTSTAHRYKLDIETGKEIWISREGEGVGFDTAYIEAYDGVVLAGSEPSPQYQGGQHKLYGLNSTDGSKLWEMRIDLPTWNYVPVFPGDDTYIFMDISGGVYRIGIHDGRTVWHTPVRGAWEMTDGGVSLGPDGTSYACSNKGTKPQGGLLRAYQFSDGQLLWETHLRHGCTSWPAIHSDNSWGVVPIGHFVSFPPSLVAPQWYPDWLKTVVHVLSLTLGKHLHWVPGWWWIPKKATEIFAFDTKTGREKWSYRTPDWERLAARGDDEGLEGRLFHNALGPGFPPICLPTTWSAPTISADNTVHVGHVSGTLYAVRDADGNNVIDEATEVSSMDIEDAPLPNNAAWAPGMMAFGTCGGLYVFGS